MLGTRWIEEHSALFGRMAERKGVDWSKVTGPADAIAVRHAVHACLSCRDVTACRTALDAPAATPQDMEFCPNRELFERFTQAG
jgi:hypothetical protein